MYSNVEKYANTSSAALAIALDEAVKDGTISKGDLVVLTVFGGGFTWGANVLEWGK
jgi:3-oxoacyl-[acyl-carrier-protein] synthase-3